MLPIKRFSYRTLLNCATWTERSRPSVLDMDLSRERSTIQKVRSGWKSCSFVVWVSVTYTPNVCIGGWKSCSFVVWVSVTYTPNVCNGGWKKLFICVLLVWIETNHSKFANSTGRPTWMRNASIHPYPRTVPFISLRVHPGVIYDSPLAHAPPNI
jgi:hypothetical protein